MHIDIYGEHVIIIMKILKNPSMQLGTIILLIVAFLTALFGAQTVQGPAIDITHPNPEPTRETVSGTIACAPHTHNNRPVTLLCAYSLKVDNEYYLLEIPEGTDISTISIGEQYTLTGLLDKGSIIDSDYAITGTLIVETIE